jgi:nicotinate dehydrogenase subunit A
MTSSSRLETGHSTTPSKPSEAKSNQTMLLQVNGSTCEIVAARTTPLLYVLRNDLRLNGPKFGCGLGECGACTVILDDLPARSCVISRRWLRGPKHPHT